MIKVESIRNNGGEDYRYPDQERTTASAFVSLVRFELGYGATLLDLSLTKVQVRTQVLAATDVVTFTGSEEEMRPLVAAAVIFFRDLSVEEANKIFMDRTWKQLQQLERSFNPGSEGVRAGFCAWFGPLLMNQPKAKIAAIAICGFEAEDTKKALSLPEADFYSLCELKLNGEDVSCLLEN